MLLPKRISTKDLKDYQLQEPFTSSTKGDVTKLHGAPSLYLDKIAQNKKIYTLI